MARALLISLPMGLSGAPAAAAVKPLPRSFMWGVAGSAWQTEGGAVADNWHHYASVRPGTPWLAQLDPFGMYLSLRVFARRFPRLPIVTTENGMPTDDGRPRPDGYTRGQNLADNVYWLQRAREDGVEVVGYLYWSLTDNYEIGSYRGRFGLYTVDARADPSLRRRPTDAVPVDRSITRRRGVGRGYRLVRRPAAADCERVPVRFRGSCLAATRGDG